jgi:hypothetical protein
MVFLLGPVYSGQAHSLSEISKPQRIYIDSNQVFITEGATIYIYSLKHFKLQNKFGKRGEGPGEFKESGEGIYLIFKPEHLQVISSGRLSTFSREGRFIREETISNPRRFEFQSLGDRYVGTAIHAEKGRVFFIVNLFDKNFNKLKEIYRYRHPFFPSHKPINPVDLRISTYIVYQDKIFYDDEKGAIHVLDHDGMELYVIPCVSERIKVTDTHKKRYLAFWKADLKPEYNAFRERLRFSSYFPSIRNFHIVDDRIYIITFMESGINSQIRIFDLQGRPVKKSWAPLAETNMLIPLGFNHYTIYRDSIYILKENDETEEWQLVIQEIN